MTHNSRLEAFLCTAYARACGVTYDGTAHPPDSDDAPATLTIAANPPVGTVEITVEDTNVRIVLPLGIAWLLARRIDDEVRRVARSPHYTKDSPYWEPPLGGAA